MARSYFAGAALAFGSLFAAAGSADAQDVRWRHDYNAALREAAETGRPLLFDFGTEACFWCKKLDATTFRIPAVVETLNGCFIPVKVDADRAASLTRALGVQSYPTLIFAAPNGSVLDRHEGYADGPQMSGLMARVVQRVPKPSVSKPVLAVTEKAVSPAAGWDLAREEVATGLARDYLERGSEMSRQGRLPDAGEYLSLAASLSPASTSATAARAILGRLPRDTNAAVR